MIDPSEIHALADGELSASEAEAVRAKIAGCPRSTAEYHTILAIKSTLQNRAGAYTCETTWAKSVRRLDEIDKTKRIEGFVGRYAWGLVGSFALVIAIGGYWTRTHRTGVISSSDVTHVSADMIHIPGMRTMANVKQWLTQKFGFGDHSSFDDGKLVVTNAYEGSVNGFPAARLSLRDNEGPADLLIIRGAQAVDGVRPLQDGEFSAGRVDGLNIVTWSRDGNALLLVSPRSVDEMVQIASNLRVR